MNGDILEILVSEERLRDKAAELGRAISADYAGRNPLFLGVLKGSFIFMADLMRAVTIPCEVDFLAVSSYGRGAENSGSVRILKDLEYDVAKRHIIIIEDILDSGLTLGFLKDILMARNPASIAICALLDKPARRKADIAPDYTGFVIPDEFVVGYGLDYAEMYRNLPYIGVLKREIYEKKHK